MSFLLVIFCTMIVEYSNNEILDITPDKNSITIRVKNGFFPTILSSITLSEMKPHQVEVTNSINFISKEFNLIKEKDFEGDLSVLEDEYGDLEKVTDEDVNRELKSQYKEYKSSLKSIGNDLSLYGTLWLLPFTKRKIKFNNLPDKEINVSIQLNIWYGLISSTEFRCCKLKLKT